MLRLLFGLGAFCGGVLVYSSEPSSRVTGVVLLGVLGLLGWSGHTIQQGVRWVKHYNEAFSMWSRGELDAAHAHLAKIPRKILKGWVGIAVENLKSAMHIGVGEFTAARTAADRALIERRDLYSRWIAPIVIEHISLAHGARALASAGLGDEAGVRQEVEWMRGEEAASPHARARVVLSEAILYARRDDRSRLADVMYGATNVTEFLQPRERTLFRTLRQMLRIDPAHVYRQRGNLVEETEESDLHAWMNRLVPRSADHMPKAPTPTARASRTPEAPQASADHVDGSSENLGSATAFDAALAGLAARARLDGAVREKQVAPKRGRALLTFAVWFVLIFVFLFVYDLLGPNAPAPSAHTAAVASATSPWLTTFPVIAGLAAALVGLLAWVWRFNIGVHAKVRRASLLSSMRRHDEARAIVDPMTRSILPSAKAPALFTRATDRETILQFAEALADCEEAIALFARTPKAAITLPEIHGQRGILLAILAKTTDQSARLEEAEATLSLIETTWPTHVYFDRMRYRLAMMIALARQDYVGAANLGASRSATLPIGYRDDLLADLVNIAVNGAASREESHAIASEIDADPELHAWFRCVVPEIIDAVRDGRKIGQRARVEYDAKPPLAASPGSRVGDELSEESSADEAAADEEDTMGR